MRLFTSLIATAAVLFSASTAFAAANWSVSASSLSGDPLSALLPGDQIILDITLTTTGPELLGISGSVNDYDASVVSYDSAPIFSTAVLAQVCFPSAGCFNTQANLEAGVRNEVGVEGAGNEDTFLSILTVNPATGDGTLDPAPQFRLVYNAAGPGSTVLRVGTFSDYADAYTGGDNVVNNQSVAVTVVPEPGTALLMGLGLAGLAGAGRRN